MADRNGRPQRPTATANHNGQPPDTNIARALRRPSRHQTPTAHAPFGDLLDTRHQQRTRPSATVQTPDTNSARALRRLSRHQSPTAHAPFGDRPDTSHQTQIKPNLT